SRFPIAAHRGAGGHLLWRRGRGGGDVYRLDELRPMRRRTGDLTTATRTAAHEVADVRQTLQAMRVRVGDLHGFFHGDSGGCQADRGLGLHLRQRRDFDFPLYGLGRFRNTQTPVHQRLRRNGDEGLAVRVQHRDVRQLRRGSLDFRLDGAVAHQPFAQSYASPGGSAKRNDYDGNDETPGHPYPLSTRVSAVYKLDSDSENRLIARSSLLTENLATVFPHGVERHIWI